MDQTRLKLSEDLRPIYDLEMSSGNSILRVDEPAGTLCPLAVVFAQPLKRGKILTELELSGDVVWHENDDPRYEVDGMAGFTSKKTRHFIYGPIQRGR